MCCMKLSPPPKWEFNTGEVVNYIEFVTIIANIAPHYLWFL